MGIDSVSYGPKLGVMTDTATTATADDLEPFNIINDADRVFLRLRALREKLVDLAEDVSIKLEANMKPDVAATLDGDEQKKAAHLFESQAAKIERELNKLALLAANFRVHIY